MSGVAMLGVPADWSAQRTAAQRVAAHLLARARHQASGRFSLEPSPGGLATPTFTAPDGALRRIRLAGGEQATLIDERIGADGARSRIVALGDVSLAGLASDLGIALDPGFSVGHDTPELGDPTVGFSVSGAAIAVLGQWYALGAMAIDRAVAAFTDPAAAVGRIWPEHFDFGTDLAVGGGRRCNLGASPGDGFHDMPYLYVGPWDDARPGADDGYWNAPFGAVLGHDDVAGADDPLGRATSFLAAGIGRLAAG